VNVIIYETFEKVKVFEKRQAEEMDINTKLAVLDQIYRVYDDFTGKLDLACQKYCAHCCTCNVTLTTLEGYRISRHLISSGQSSLFEKLQSVLSSKRFQPVVTTNQLAQLCALEKDLPLESSDPAWGPCPLLRNDECIVYSQRPFGCRCMVSKHDCQEAGYAEMDPLVLTLNNVCLQYIEHVDAHGFTGNLSDVLGVTAKEQNRQKYKSSKLKVAGTSLIANRPIKVLMIPPEHRHEVKPILDSLNSIQVPMKRPM
jgi:Fe-S-cluster containining protein